MRTSYSIPFVRVKTADLASSVEAGEPTSGTHLIHYLLVTVGNATSGEVIRSDLNLDTIAWENTNAVHTHFPGTVCQNLMTVLQFDFEHGVG